MALRNSCCILTAAVDVKPGEPAVQWLSAQKIGYKNEKNANSRR